MPLALDRAMYEGLPLLMNGRCEGLKASVHGAVMAMATVCALYNAAAWLKRRQMHSAVNAGLYAALVGWELHHVLHHIECRPVATAPVTERTQAA